MQNSHRISELRRLLASGRHVVAACPDDFGWMAGQGPLPGRSLVEVLGHGPGAGAAEFALSMTGRLPADEGRIVVVDTAGVFHPPGAARLGIDLSRCVVLRPDNELDALWALEQALRTRGVAAIVGWLGDVDGRVLRRLQLAVEESGGRGLLIRPAHCRGRSSWTTVRLQVTPLASAQADRRRLRIDVLKWHGHAPTGSKIVELSHATGDMRLVAELADRPADRAAASA